MKTIISAHNLSYAYNNQVKVLDAISFEVLENDFVGLIGPNGGGKSTLLKIIIGLLRQDSGEIKVFAEEPKKARDKIGYVPQYSQIDLNYPIRVWEVVISGLLGKKKLFSAYTKDEKQRVLKALTQMNLGDLQDRPIGDLSGGQRQRVLLARALVRDPELLLLDEPTNNVDQKSGNDLYYLLSELNKKMTIIIVSHDFSTVSKYVNKIFCLNKKITCNEADQITGDCSCSNFKHIHHSGDCIIH